MKSFEEYLNEARNDTWIPQDMPDDYIPKTDREKFKKELEKYNEQLADLRYALKSTREGLSNVMNEDLDQYKIDELHFIQKMVLKLYNTMGKSLKNLFELK